MKVRVNALSRRLFEVRTLSIGTLDGMNETLSSVMLNSQDVCGSWTSMVQNNCIIQSLKISADMLNFLSPSCVLLVYALTDYAHFIFSYHYSCKLDLIGPKKFHVLPWVSLILISFSYWTVYHRNKWQFYQSIHS